MAAASVKAVGRAVAYRLPVVGQGLRYVKRLVFLPWNFHKHFQASNAYRADLHRAVHALAGTQRQATVDLMNSQTHALAEHVRAILFEQVPPLVHRHLDEVQKQVLAEVRRSTAEPVRKLVADFQLAVAELATEMQSLNDRHAACYDRLAEQLRHQTAQLRSVADAHRLAGLAGVGDKLAELAAAQDDLARQVAEVRDHGCGTAAKAVEEPTPTPGRLKLRA